MATCRRCQSEVTAPEGTQCDRCDVEYCSKSCENLHWKKHKNSCAKNRPKPGGGGGRAFGGGARISPSGPAKLSPSLGLDEPVPDPFTRLDKNKFLHDRPEVDTYRILIDTYRLRMEDNAVIEGKATPKSLYEPGVSDATDGFRAFLDKVKGKPRLLPPWWSEEKQAECEALGGDGGERWYSLRAKVTKASVIQHYGDELFPMQLRMMGEPIYGSAPGGGNGSMMRRMFAEREAGTSQYQHISHIDASGR
ncbi:hypothetical protein CSHISOI_11701 [Colletotrichum shisoi]|uniref:MYND-type domain-containing protein n=1 Tax=Colletotrichum shisoi TaxID=2078593 RepID=A0A5Q4BAL1_9PEZI|nr:hypothetical protein CSHISOI_11701 [Colletotrichum shisoi]